MTSGAADTIFTGGIVLTLDDDGHEHEAMAIGGDRILALGTNEEIRALAGEGTVEHELGGRVLIPGLFDVQSHIDLLAVAKEICVDLRSGTIHSIDELVDAFRKRAETTPAGTWIYGQGSHSRDEERGRYPDRWDLDRASSDHPIVARYSWHINILNSKAIELLGLDDRDLKGLERDENGVLTGRTFEAYNTLGVPDIPEDVMREGMLAVMRDYLSFGITSIGDMPLGAQGLPMMLAMGRDGVLPVRANLIPAISPGVVSFEEVVSGDLAKRFEGLDPDWIALNGVKFVVDGGLSSGEAALTKPYTHMPESSGVMYYTEEELAEKVRAVDAVGLQVTFHALGDRAEDAAAAALISTGNTIGRKPPHRIEHTGMLFVTEERIRTWLDNEIMPVPTQPLIYSFTKDLEAFLGRERTEWLFPFKTMLARGIRIAGNSGSSGANPHAHNPYFGMWCCRARLGLSGALISPEESVEVADALLMYTRYAAESIGVEDDRGSLEPGKLADFAILPIDPRTADDEALTTIRADETWVGGRVAYRADRENAPT